MSTFAEARSWLVVEVSSGFGPATLAAKHLADLGSLVVRVEEDDPRNTWPTRYDRDLFELVTRGKHSVGLSRATPGGDTALDALLGRAEIAIVDRDGLARLQAADPSRSLADRYPRLTVCACTWFGVDGPMAAWAGGEEIVQAVGGIMSITGHRDGPATRVAGAPFTLATSMFAVTSILADVAGKRRGATGGFLDVAVVDAAIAFHSASLPVYTLSGTPPRGIGNRHSMSAPWNSFRCADGWVVVCGGNHPNWVRLCETIGRPDLLADPRYATQEDRIAHVDALEAEITAWTSARPVREVEAAFNAGAIAAGSILPLSDVLRHPQFLERDLLDARCGRRKAGAVFHADRQPLDTAETPWRPGAATRDILVGRCGLPAADCERWIDAGDLRDEKGYDNASAA